MSATPRFSRDFTVSIGTSSPAAICAGIWSSSTCRSRTSRRLGLTWSRNHPTTGSLSRRMSSSSGDRDAGCVCCTCLSKAGVYLRTRCSARARSTRRLRSAADHHDHHAAGWIVALRNSVAACCRRSSASAAEVRSLRAVSAGFFVCSTRNATLLRSMGSVMSRRCGPLDGLEAGVARGGRGSAVMTPGKALEGTIWVPGSSPSRRRRERPHPRIRCDAAALLPSGVSLTEKSYRRS